jgi:hypothetical protein
MDVQLIAANPSIPGAIIDPEGAAHRRYGALHECLYWVRTDGYVGFRSQPVSAEAFGAYIKKITA